MKKILFLLNVLCFIAVMGSKAATFNTVSGESSYAVNDDQIESLFANSTDISSDVLQLNSNLNLFENKTTQTSNAAIYSKKFDSEKSAAVAIILDVFLGGLGIHRAYLGTKTFTWIGYILTCGGIGGIVPFVDLIVLAINAGDISKYVDNPKFFMW
jgi:TM2 domain-containing membrane protein YozV